MKAAKKFLAILFDSLLIILLTIIIATIMCNSLGRFSLPLFADRDFFKNICPFLIIGSSITIIYLFLSALNKWKTIGKLLFIESNKLLLYSTLAFIIDFTVILMFTYSIDFIISKYVYIPFFLLLAIVIFVYHFLEGILRGKSLGKMFFGIQVKGASNELSIIQGLKREIVFKFGIVFLCPWLFFYFIGIIDPFNIFIDVISLGLLSSILFFVFKGELWWNKLSHTKKELISITKPLKALYFGIIISILILLFMFIKYSNNKHQDPSVKTVGFNAPLNYPEFPNTPTIKKYADFIANQHVTPKDYVLGLFDKYDIVVLCESYHGESTQWELISEIVKDKRFIEKVGNVFTEYGSAKHQNKVDSFLTQKFSNEAELEKGTASVMEYMSGGFYFFLKNLNKENNLLPDSLKVKEHFTDILDWDYLSDNRMDSVGLNLDKRDSLMAQITIDWYRKNLKQGKTKKCLIITNTRHAFGYAGGVERLKKINIHHTTFDNQAQYIYEAFPNKTACVLENAPINRSKTLFKPICMPINKGIWDKAYQLNKFKPVGFDLKNSPFGLDAFDMHPLLGTRSRVLYQDIFNGVIFDKRFEELQAKDYPYKRYAVENEYFKKYPKTDSIMMRKDIEQSRWSCINNEINQNNSRNFKKDIAWGNILSLMFIVISFYLTIFILIMSLFFRLLKNENKNHTITK